MVNELTEIEVIIGLEIHAQLAVKSKIFSSDPTRFGADSNTNISVVSLGLPGSLPRLNKKVVDYAIMLGHSLGSTISEYTYFDRKNYFYTDLPKGYQITQDAVPICVGGKIKIKSTDGSEKYIRINRVHMEEDAGKSIHDQDPSFTFIDLNRAGVPLLEIVSEPDLRSSVEAYNYLAEIRKLLRYLGICDGNMEEGNLRCDANVSIMPKGSSIFGTRTEIKNLNSLNFLKKAIDFEIGRQHEILKKGGSVTRQTLSFDTATGATFPLRSKEEAHDYRYFPEPDLTPVLITKTHIENLKSALPELPEQIVRRYTTEIGLTEYDALVISENKETADYFNELITFTGNFKAAANWIMGPVKSFLNEKNINIDQLSTSPKKLAALIDLVEKGKISFSAAGQKVFPKLETSPEMEPLQVMKESDLLIEHKEDEMEDVIKDVLAMYPEKVAEYRKGKKGLAGMFMGEIMKKTQGKADPKITSKMLKEMLEK